MTTIFLRRPADYIPHVGTSGKARRSRGVGAPVALGLAAALAGFGLVDTPAYADPGAAQICPPFQFAGATAQLPNGPNLAPNPSFETLGAGMVTSCTTCDTLSAAAGWFVHTSNNHDLVTTQRLPSTAPQGTDPAPQSWMLQARAGAKEGGIYFNARSMPRKLMFSAWVKVSRGHVELGVNGADTTHPKSWSTKHNQWEVLRVCTDGSQANGQPFFIYNQDPTGGIFSVDRVEIRQIP